MKDINKFTIKSTVFFIAKDSKHNSNNSNFYTTDFFSIVIFYYKALLCINIYTWSLRNKYFLHKTRFPLSLWPIVTKVTCFRADGRSRPNLNVI